jgi:putative oxidoreductase
MTTTQPERPRETVGMERRTAPPATPARPTLRDHMDRAEAAVINLARRIGIPAMRVALGLTFIWFGALKITNDTPVAELVANTVNWLPLVEGSWFVPFLGAVEVLLGGALVLGKGLRAVLPLLFAHLAGTFLALVTQPDVAFQDGNPLMLTTEGEFVVKNMILLSGVLILYATQRVRTAAADTPAPPEPARP